MFNAWPTGLLTGACLALAVAVFPARGASVMEDLYDEQVFQSARKQIGEMREAELDEFRDYLASCGTHAGGEYKQFICEQNARRYILKYGGDRPVQRLIEALAAVEFLIDAVDAADAGSGANAAQKGAVLKHVDRYSNIRAMMEEAIRAAYRNREGMDP